MVCELLGLIEAKSFLNSVVLRENFDMREDFPERDVCSILPPEIKMKPNFWERMEE